MENFRIDFTLSNPFPDGKKIGENGEKNAAQLIITPPENLASREEIRSYVVAFSTERGPVRVGPFPKSETLTVPVRNALTVGSALSVQLEGFDADGEFIIKSPVLSGITISNSIRDCETSDGSASGGESIIPGHSHENLDVLDSLSENDGVLLYNGKEISGGGTDSGQIKTVVLENTEKFQFYTEYPVSGSFTLLANHDSEGNFYVPLGAEIVSLELNIIYSETPEWVDIRDMNTSDSFQPYTVNCHRTFYHNLFDGAFLATVYYPVDMNSFYHAVSNYSIYGLRVRYIEGSGETE